MSTFPLPTFAPVTRWRGGLGLAGVYFGEYVDRSYCTICSAATCATRAPLDDVPARALISDRSPVTAGLRYRYTGPVWTVTGRNRWNSNLNSNGAVQPVRTGIPAGLTGLPAGLTGNRSNSIFFLFWFKFKCPQSILNKYLYNIF